MISVVLPNTNPNSWDVTGCFYQPVTSFIFSNNYLILVMISANKFYKIEKAKQISFNRISDSEIGLEMD
jgi:hypothetical protein